MPPFIQQLLENKRLLIAAGVGLVVVLIVIIVAAGQMGGSKAPGDKPLTKEQLVLAKVTSLGKAIEIQALLARQGLHVNYDDSEGDTKVKLQFEQGATIKDRDKALITLVQSGLMDKNVGLEAFDKGDLTASREEKRIKLIRSQQGELARLIRKIDPIEDAAVSIAIPEQTLFKSEEKPVSASVQVTLPVGTMLTRNQVRAISNLMVGSIQGLEASRLAISDTNGNTYSSVLDSGSEIDDKLEEQDNYMKQKVAAQLDRLVGAGNYVVTVSTELRQAPKEMLVQEFDPQGAVVSSKQSFNENLNTGSQGPGAGGPVSSLLPNGLEASAMGAANRKDYLRNGVEVTYNNSKTQWMETLPIGMVEDISIAVTIDSAHFPNMSLNELQLLLARAASPKVKPENVSIAKSTLPQLEPLSSAKPMTSDSASSANLNWLYWLGGGSIVLVFLMMLLGMRKSGGGPIEEELQETQRELAQLRDLAYQQQSQLQATQQQTQMLLEAQKQAMAAPPMPSATVDASRQITGGGLEEVLAPALEELRDVVSSETVDDEDLGLQIKSWIEAS
ncbi:MAG TPA: flagellar M-ring protein FliF C-terminal domain-containing protein [Oculatellaceae cyanobacterium]|jgi:flagellar M-ring protein FliF